MADDRRVIVRNEDGAEYSVPVSAVEGRTILRNEDGSAYEGAGAVKPGTKAALAIEAEGLGHPVPKDATKADLQALVDSGPYVAPAETPAPESTPAEG